MSSGDFVVSLPFVLVEVPAPRYDRTIVRCDVLTRSRSQDFVGKVQRIPVAATRVAECTVSQIAIRMLPDSLVFYRIVRCFASKHIV